ncbi:MAG: hypothetical protein NUV56_03715, partial [Candidatus Uhrbacteria bacterium]|nr:hypothetical protein [Candidatus Uhrbacteria bacterium]
FQAESDNELTRRSEIDHIFSDPIDGYRAHDVTPDLTDFVCLKDGRVQIYDDSKTAVTSCTRLAQSLRTGTYPLKGTAVVRVIGQAKLMRMPFVDSGDGIKVQPLGYVRPDGVLVIMRADTLEAIGEKLLNGKYVTAGRDERGQIDNTVILFGKTAINTYTLERHDAVTFFGADNMRDYAQV